jgi:hypothetical protein
MRRDDVLDRLSGCELLQNELNGNPGARHHRFPIMTAGSDTIAGAPMLNSSRSPVASAGLRHLTTAEAQGGERPRLTARSTDRGASS